jgi:hypothetical protein
VIKGRYYYQHVQMHDPSKWKYECQHCQERFQSKYKLLEHEAVIHTGEAMFKCDKCLETFMTSARRAVHQKTCCSGMENLMIIFPILDDENSAANQEVLKFEVVDQAAAATVDPDLLKTSTDQILTF